MTVGQQLDSALASIRELITSFEAAMSQMADGTMQRFAEIEANLSELRTLVEQHTHATPDPEFPGIQAAYDGLPDDAAELVIPAGTYTEELRLDRAGVVVRGDGDVTIIGRIHIAANNVTLRDVTVQEGAESAPDHWGAIWSDGVDHVHLASVMVSGSAWAGIALKGGGGHCIEEVDSRWNGALGIRLESLTASDVRDCYLKGNNTRGLDPGWEAGGLKATGNYGGISNVTVEGCTVHDNDGPGIWFDVDATDCVIRANVVHHNTRQGINYELSSGGRIENNTVYENGWGFRAWGFGAGILLQNSNHCTVINNLLAWNGDGVVVISQDRGEARWNNVVGNLVSGNTIAHEDDNEAWNAFAGAVVEDWAGVATLPESGNSGNQNQYYFTRWLESEPYAGNGVWILRGRNGNADFYGVPEIFNGIVLAQSELEAVLAAASVSLEPEDRG